MSATPHPRSPALWAAALLIALPGCGTGGGKGSGSDSPTGSPSPSLALGQPCSLDSECASERCEWGQCRHDCHDWAECVGLMGSREYGCLWQTNLDPIESFRPGVCALPGAEIDCASDTDCPGEHVCDAKY